MTTDFIQSALCIGDLVVTSANSIYLNGETAIKIYLGDLLVYCPKRAEKVTE